MPADPGGGSANRGSARLPHLQKHGTANQLIVDSKPYLALAAELNNSSASSLEYTRPLWPRLSATNINTVLATVSWELLEPEEGRFNFGLVDGLIQDARRHNLRLVFLWFKSGRTASPPTSLSGSRRTRSGSRRHVTGKARACPS